MNDEKAGAWFVRIPTDALTSPYIMNNATAADWRVFLCIAKHQGYQNRRTFPLYVAKTAEEARCTIRTAFRAIDFWVSVGALLKTKRRRINVYEIPRHFSVPPGIDDSQRHNTPRNKNRGESGRYMPLLDTFKVTAKGTIEVTAKGTPNQKSFFRSLNQNPPPPPPGGNGRSSETSVRPISQISDATIKDFLMILGKEKTLEYLRQGNYPIPPFLLEEERS